jgi:hypothetical protein
MPVDSQVSSGYHYSAPPKPDYALRLQAQRERILRSLDSVANIGCCLMTLLLGYFTFYIFGMIAGLIAAGASRGNEDLFIAIGTLVGLVATVALGFGMQFLMKILARSIFRSYYREATRWLYHTDMLRLFVDENQTLQIIELINSTPGLRWISQPKPRTLEELLEFAACYFTAYKRLLYGPGRLDAGSVALGSLIWYTGQRQCIALGCCCCNPYSGWMTLPLWVFTGVGYINRLAVEACCLDYLMDSPRDPANSDKSGTLSAAHTVGM